MGSYTKAHDEPTRVPKGFYETRQRIRAAYEVREKVLQQRENRLARIEATVPYQASGALGRAQSRGEGAVRGLGPCEGGRDERCMSLYV